MGSAINTIVNMFSGIFSTTGKGVQDSGNRYHNPVYTEESKVMPLVYVYAILAVALLLFAVFAVTAKK